jgi:4'-phosphopantetheinyl transferase EntD
MSLKKHIAELASDMAGHPALNGQDRADRFLPSWPESVMGSKDDNSD